MDAGLLPSSPSVACDRWSGGDPVLCRQPAGASEPSSYKKGVRFIYWRGLSTLTHRCTVALGRARAIVARPFQRSLIKGQKLPSVLPIGSVMIAPM